MQDTNIEGFRLSPQQKHLWLLQQNGYEPAYRVHGSILIEGTINPEALKATLETVVHRYEILNTTFHQVPGLTIPVQVINHSNGLLLTEHNLSELRSQEKETKLETLLREERQLQFDLEQGPLLKIIQVVLSPKKRLLHISLPALCADVTTVKNLVNEISNTYDAHLRGVGATAEDEIMQYADISECPPFFDFRDGVSRQVSQNTPLGRFLTAKIGYFCTILYSCSYTLVPSLDPSGKRSYPLHG